MPKRKVINGKTTIEKLARMSQREFASIDGRFDNVDVRFDRIDEDINILHRDMEAGFGALAEILKAARSDLKEIKNQVGHCYC